MHNGIRTAVWMTAAAGLVLLVAVNELAAEEGIVSISDRSASETQTVSPEPEQQPEPAPSVYSSGARVYQAPHVVQEGRGYEVTGNPIKDLWSDMKMRRRARKTRKRLQEQAEQYCPNCGRWAGDDDDDDDVDDGRSCLERVMWKWYQHDLACKRRILGHFATDGCCGQGCPFWGQYHLLYAANPYYLDSRDARVYSAAGYGVPVSVPLAPNVRHAYNYGWGIPSSRVTPISTVAPW